jgi:hypothetical protein
MDKVYVWYITDNESGRDISVSIADIGLDVITLSIRSLKKKNIPPQHINIFIFDLTDSDIQDTLSVIKGDQRLHSFPKYIILQKRKIKEALDASSSFLHIEFISRPVQKREFILLLEKTIIVERYREVLKYISQEAVYRIEAYENIMNINRRDLFVTDEEKETFKNIFLYEKNLMKKQLELNESISEYTLLRQKEMFYDERRIKAEEMLDELKGQEVINIFPELSSQGDLPFKSSSESYSAGEPGMINATDPSHSNGKIEALKNENAALAVKLAKLKEEKEKQSREINSLKQEIKVLRSVNGIIH